MLVIADRLKITISQLLQMEMWEYNLWLGYLMVEQEEQQEQMRKLKHK